MGGDNTLEIFSKERFIAEDVAEKIIKEVNRIETKYSRYLPTSVVSLINTSAGKGPISVDDETACLLNYADACYRQSDGLFDITTGALRRAWKYSDKHLPEHDHIKSLLPKIGWRKLSWKSPTLLLKEDEMELDLGGIGKEYAVDRAAAILLENGLSNSLVNLAGDIRVCGSRGNKTPWAIGIKDPRNGKNLLGVIELSSGAVATSGDYERAIEIDGKRYSHILNPKTGWPAEGIQSVTVIADSCLIAGSITTTAMLKGRKAERYLEDLGIPYLLVTTENEFRCSKLISKLLKKEMFFVEDLGMSQL